MKKESIVYTNNASHALREIISSGEFTHKAILVDENTKTHCYPLVAESLGDHLLIEIKSGEVHKNLDTCIHVWQELTSHHFDRNSILINLGGGVIGDLGGFCAATYKRGIHFMNIPTTLLAQVDASVGGKLGVDFDGLKNHIGLFREPLYVLIDQEFLKTLPARELKSGFAEVIKHHLIADSNEWEKITPLKFDELHWATLVPHSVKIKQKIVAKDPLESGLRKVLNFGHTIGHAIESHLIESGKSVLHGEAIAAGMICEAYISHQRKLITVSELQEITTYITTIFDKITLGDQDREQIIGYLIHDKKNRDNKVLSTLLKGIGTAVWDEPINEDQSLASLLYYDRAYM